MDRREIIELLAWLAFIGYPLVIRLARMLYRRAAGLPDAEPAESAPEQEPKTASKRRRQQPRTAPPSTPPAGAPPSRPPAPGPALTRAARGSAPSLRQRREALRESLTREIADSRRLRRDIRNRGGEHTAWVSGWFEPTLDEYQSIVANLDSRANNARLQAADAALQQLRAQRDTLSELGKALFFQADRRAWARQAWYAELWGEFAQFLGRRTLSWKPPQRWLLVRADAPAARRRAEALGTLLLIPPNDVRDTSLAELLLSDAHAVAAHILRLLPDASDQVLEVARAGVRPDMSLSEYAARMPLQRYATTAWAAGMTGPAYLEYLRRRDLRTATSRSVDLVLSADGEILPHLWLHGYAALAALRRGGHGADGLAVRSRWVADREQRGLTSQTLVVGAEDASVPTAELSGPETEKEIDAVVSELLRQPFMSLDQFSFVDIADISFSLADNSRAREAARSLNRRKAGPAVGLREAVAAACFAGRREPDRVADFDHWLLDQLAPTHAAHSAAQLAEDEPPRARTKRENARRGVVLREILQSPRGVAVPRRLL